MYGIYSCWKKANKGEHPNTFLLRTEETTWNTHIKEVWGTGMDKWCKAQLTPHKRFLSIPLDYLT